MEESKLPNVFGDFVVLNHPVIIALRKKEKFMEYQRIWHRNYTKTQKWKAWSKEYNKKVYPHVKAYRQTPDVKAHLNMYQKLYFLKNQQRIRGVQNKYRQTSPIYKKWHTDYIAKNRLKINANKVKFNSTPERKAILSANSKKYRNSEIGKIKKQQSRIKRRLSIQKYTQNYIRRPDVREKRNAYAIKYTKNLYHSDINFKIRHNLRTALYKNMKRYGNGKAMRSGEYGIDYDAIAKHLGNPPKDDNKYEIDHTPPCCSYDLTKPEQVKECFAPKNLRWLTREENRKKVGEDRKLSILKRV